MIIDVVAKQMDKSNDVLFALDAIVYDSFEENGCVLQELADKVVDSFLARHPECRGWNLTLFLNLKKNTNQGRHSGFLQSCNLGSKRML